MLTFTLAAALFAAPAATSSNDSLLDALEGDFDIVLRLGDLASAASVEAPTAWMRVLGDPRLSDAIARGVEIPPEAAKDIDRALRLVRSGAFGVKISDDGQLVGAVRADEGLIASLRSTVSRFEGELAWTDESILGHPGHRIGNGGPEGVTLVEVDRAILVGVGPNDTVEPQLGRVLAALEAGRQSAAPWWESRPVDRVDDALVEAFFSMDALGKDDPEMTEILSEGQIAYLALGDDASGASEISFLLTTAGSKPVAALAGAFGEAETDLLKLAPKSSLAVTVMKVDFGVLIDAALMLSGEAAARDQYEGALMAASSSLGVDVEEDIIGNLTGDLVVVQYPVPAAGIDIDDPMAAADLAPTIALGISDSEPFYTLIETAEVFLGPDGVEVEDTDSATLWTFEPFPELSITLALTESMLIVGTSDRAKGILARASGAGSAGLVGDSDMAFIGDHLGGTYLGVTDIGPGLDLVLASLEAEEQEVPYLAPVVLEILRDHLSGLGFGEAYFTEAVVGFKALMR
ncbi:MAG: hypothetical protein AAF726_19320 [Planctomycetota bacterium]